MTASAANIPPVSAGRRLRRQLHHHQRRYGICRGSAGAGIGGGFCGDNTGSGYNITINGGDVKAVGRFGGAIGSGASFYGGTNHGGYNIRITGGTVTAIGEAGT